jgi:hypothetical protein
MKKNLYSTIAVLMIASLFMPGINANAQGGVYFREGFEEGTGWPSASGDAIPFKEVVTTTSGSWYTYGGYRSNGPTGSCPTQTGGMSHLRFANLTAVQPGYTPADSSYLITPLANAGIFNISFINGRATRRFTVYKTTDSDPNTSNWEQVAHFTNTNIACEAFTVNVNDAAAKRLKIVARSGTDSDLDTLVMTSVGTLPTKFGTINVLQKNDEVIASWNAFNESNVKGYYLQRSRNGSTFEDVSFVQAKNALSADYSAGDKIKAGGLLYYRVKSIDFDGKEGFSPVAKINIDNGLANGVTIVNPVRGNRLEVQLNGLEPGVYQVSLNSLSGSRLNTRSVNVQGSRTSVSLDIPVTAGKGIQVLTISGNRYRFSGKIIVE